MSNRWFGGLINKTRPTTTGGQNGVATGVSTAGSSTNFW